MMIDGEAKIIYEHGKPYGIRDRTGFLFFFRNISLFQGQDERYRSEIEQLSKLADFLQRVLNEA